MKSRQKAPPESRPGGPEPKAAGLIRQALESKPRKGIRIKGFARAAALVLVAERGDGLRLVFTRRAERLARHAGQISFPGGCRDATDRSMVATALREAREEIGVEPGAVRVLGRLDDVAVYTGFVITPVVGWLAGPARFKPDAREVGSVFTLGIKDLARPKTFTCKGTRPVEGKPQAMYEFRSGGRLVWGATARMVHNLLSLLGWPRPLRI